LDQVTAILAIRNEAAQLRNCLRHLVRNGAQIAIIDNGSTDESPQIYGAAEFAGRLALVRHLPFDGAFSLERQLRLKQEIAATVLEGWVLHVDADERMHTRRPGETLAEGLTRLGAAGWNAVNFDEFVFLPLDEDDRLDADGLPNLRHYYFYEPSAPRLVRARRAGADVSMVESGGHTLAGDGLRLAPERFALRHYMFQSQAHAFEKYPSRVYAEADLARGWHAQRAGQPAERYRFPPARRLKRLDDVNARGLDTTEPWREHYWRRKRGLHALVGKARELARPGRGGGAPRSAQAPVGVGGVGGSGTRLGAVLLRELGYYIGDDLNGALDNLWFTLLFKTPGIGAAEPADLEARCALFWARMSGARPPTGAEMELARGLAAEARFEHPADWLADRAASLCGPGASRASPRARWGWKEPNTAVIAGALLAYDPSLRYLHFVRHPLDMALSANQNQLRNWGSEVLGAHADLTPRAALAYWCAEHRRMANLLAQHPDRALAVDFDALCAAPGETAAGIAAFLGEALPPRAAQRFARLVERGRPTAPRRRLADPARFDPADLAYAAAAGFKLADAALEVA
jgi:glycosyltransferase involved in cell wall biosynthesis